ncbi:MAG: hypothetical protein PHY99_00195 [Bacteroidales bacterium]|nr:hypothetical protein [Bacteroidales bacterium]
MKIQGWMMIGMLLMTGAAMGQNESPRFQDAMAKMKAERVSFLTDKLALTVTEAEKFWPLYNEYQAKREEMMWGKREKMKKDFDPEQQTEEEMSNMLNDILDQEVKAAQLKKDYFIKMKAVLPIRKVLTLHRVEQDFMNHMLNKIRENHAPGQPKNIGSRPPRD